MRPKAWLTSQDIKLDSGDTPPYTHACAFSFLKGPDYEWASPEETRKDRTVPHQAKGRRRCRQHAAVPVFSVCIDVSAIHRHSTLAQHEFCAAIVKTIVFSAAAAGSEKAPVGRIPRLPLETRPEALKQRHRSRQDIQAWNGRRAATDGYSLSSKRNPHNLYPRYCWRMKWETSVHATDSNITPATEPSHTQCARWSPVLFMSPKVISSDLLMLGVNSQPAKARKRVKIP